MPTVDEQLTRDQVAILVTRAEQLPEFKALRQALEREREIRVRRLVGGLMTQEVFEGVAGEVRGIEVVLRAMTPKQARKPARNESQEDAA